MTAQERDNSGRLSRRTVLRGTSVGGFMLGGALDLAKAPAARAAEPPRVYTREEWGARPPSSPIQIIGPPDHIVIHHTASDNVTAIAASRRSDRG
ncbi:MAG TPA: hypothetical protein VEX15_01115 [Nocardioidaceae bacterium]|nr:hypothetical protein [Nocardioidaceae bacterium]